MPIFEHGGERLHYTTQGHGPAVLLIHSLGGSAGMWDTTWAALCDRYQLVAWDARGHGQSNYDPERNGRFSLERSATDGVALMDRLGIGRFTAVGISMGGHTAMHIAAARPERVTALVIADSSLGGRSGGEERVAGVARRVEEAGMARFAREYVRSRLEPATPEATVERYAAWVEAMTVDAYVDTLRSIVAQDLRSAAKTIAAPALILVGENDSSTPPSMAEEIKAAIVQAEYHVIPAANHFSVFDKPDEFNLRVCEFIDRIHHTMRGAQ